MRALVVFAVIAAAFGALLYFIPAAADVTPLGRMRVFQMNCTATAQPITDGGEVFEAARLWNPSATAVYIGGTDVDASTKGVPICNTASCIDDDIPVTAKTGVALCRTSAGSQAITVVVGAR